MEKIVKQQTEDALRYLKSQGVKLTDPQIIYLALCMKACYIAGVLETVESAKV